MVKRHMQTVALLVVEKKKNPNDKMDRDQDNVKYVQIVAKA